MNPQSLNDETLQYMHSTPFFNMEQQRRYEYLKKVGTEITNIAKQFTIYAEIGQKMCTEFKSLRKYFNNMEIICTDASIKPLSEILKAVDAAFTSHFNIISQKIVSPLNAFVAKELEQLINEERDYQKHFLAFNAAEEKYVSLKPQSKEKDKQEKEQQLVQEHSLATLSFFNFCMRMEGIELKLKAHLPHMFLSYITSVSGPFTECISAMNDKGEELNLTQTTIQEVNTQIQDFSNHFISLKQELASQIPIFWERLKVPFTGTNATSIQGFLWKKKSGGLSKGFHRRFFMLSNCNLSYSKSVDDALRNGKNISLKYCSVKPEPNAPRNNCFSITRKQDCFYLQALTNWDMNNWLAVIQNNITAHLNSNDTDGNNFSEELPPEKVQFFSNFCADCGMPNVSWASLNFGVSLCDNCVAEHRGLGSNVSVVRSLSLDVIDPYQKALVEAIGSQRANEILEAKLPPEEKIDQNASIQQRKTFIINKYQKKLYLNTERVSLHSAIQSQNIMDVYRSVISGRYGSVLLNENAQNQPSSSPSRRRNNGFSAAHMASVVGNPLILTLILLNNPKIVNALDDAGWSPLSYAVYYEQTLSFGVLLNFGANLTSTTGNGSIFEILKHKKNSQFQEKFPDVFGRQNRKEKTTKKQRNSVNLDSQASNSEESYSEQKNKEKGKIKSKSRAKSEECSSSSSDSENQPKSRQDDVETKFDPPHSKVHPAEFVFKDFVEDPKMYLATKFDLKKMNPSEKKKLNTAIDTLRHRLSMTSGHRLLSEDGNKDEDDETS